MFRDSQQIPDPWEGVLVGRRFGNKKDMIN